jgi:chemotaxis protein CheC
MANDITVDSAGMEIWRTLVTRGMTNAITGLSQMVGKEFSIDSINIRQIQASEMPYLLGGPDKLVVGIYISFSGASQGHILLAHQPEIAYTILDLLLGNPPGTCKSLDEMEQSALGEMGNVTGTFFLNAVADSVGVTLHPSPPVVILDMAGAILDIALAEILQERDDVYIAETSFALSDQHIQGNFLIMPNPGFLKLPMAGVTS